MNKVDEELLTVDIIAQVCHEANRAYCETLHDFSQVKWENAGFWQKEAALVGVNYILKNPDSPDSALHDNWMADKLDGGWKYGPTKDPEAKEHPCIVPFDKLPLEQQRKDKLFRAVVKALS